ncbi:MAG: hypothetical protein LBF34_01235 [Puniceicoccales bacterium]|jgi:hypothetical protein|nr:hypothetical protein [Puniceicoccales bacterium]
MNLARTRAVGIIVVQEKIYFPVCGLGFEYGLNFQIKRRGWGLVKGRNGIQGKIASLSIVFWIFGALLDTDDAAREWQEA